MMHLKPESWRHWSVAGVVCLRVATDAPSRPAPNRRPTQAGRSQDSQCRDPWITDQLPETGCTVHAFAHPPRAVASGGRDVEADRRRADESRRAGDDERRQARGRRAF